MLLIFGKGASRSGVGKGIRDYYLYGTDGDRYIKDERVVLSGNLNTLTKTIDIAHQMNYKETYRNIVISFSEDNIPKDTMLNIVEDFKKQYMAGYSNDEYVFYAEAHLPKIKNKINNETGEITNRKPHIHITIPTYSPKLEKSLLLGNHGQRLKELETWKTIAEKKYGLKVVQNSHIKKDITQVRDTKLISRKQAIEILNQVIEDNLNDKILDKHRLKMTLQDNIEDIEYINESTSKAKIPYFSIKLKFFNKAIRLKGDLFSNEHLIFSEARKQLLDKEIDSKYYEIGNPRKVPIELQKKLDFYYKKRFDYIEKRESKVRKKFDTVDNKIQRVSKEFSIVKKKLETLPKVKRDIDMPPISMVQTMIEDIEDSIEIKNTSNKYKDYKKTLNPKFIFSTLKINEVKYSINKLKSTRNADEYRIKCGKRNLNIHDFLTKEMHLPWIESKELMDKAYQKQLNFDITSKKVITTTNSISYQNKIFFEVYAYKLEHSLKGFYITKESNDVVQIVSKVKNIDIKDYGDKIIASGKNHKEQVALMLDIVEAKNWDLNHLNINGSAEFKDEMQKQIEERLYEKNEVEVHIEDEEEDKFLDGLDKLTDDIKMLNAKIVKINEQANIKNINGDTKVNHEYEDLKRKKHRYR